MVHPNRLQTSMPRVPHAETPIERFLSRFSQKIGIGVDEVTGDEMKVRGFRMAQTPAAATGNVTEANQLVPVTNWGVTMTIKTALLKAGSWLIFVAQTAAAPGVITIATEGAELINGAATITITTNYGSVRLYSDGSNWYTF